MCMTNVSKTQGKQTKLFPPELHAGAPPITHDQRDRIKLVRERRYRYIPLTSTILRGGFRPQYSTVVRKRFRPQTSTVVLGGFRPHASTVLRDKFRSYTSTVPRGRFSPLFCCSQKWI